MEPYCLKPTQTLSAVDTLKKEKGYTAFPITSTGRVGGELLGILSFGHNAERNSGSFIMTMPGTGPNGSNVSCILGYGLDWQFFNHDGTRVPQEDSL